MLKFYKTELLKLLAAVPSESELLLVHDQGIYIMSMSQPIGQRTIVYAEGCNPDKDDDWYDTARSLVGGDDFGKPFAKAATINDYLKSAKNGLKVRVTSTQIISEPY